MQASHHGHRVDRPTAQSTEQPVEDDACRQDAGQAVRPRAEGTGGKAQPMVRCANGQEQDVRQPWLDRCRGRGRDDPGNRSVAVDRLRLAQPVSRGGPDGGNFVLLATAPSQRITDDDSRRRHERTVRVPVVPAREQKRRARAGCKDFKLTSGAGCFAREHERRAARAGADLDHVADGEGVHADDVAALELDRSVGGEALVAPFPQCAGHGTRDGA
jgi:hypothetical protein